MNILYISRLDGRPWAGPTYSIPKQIKAQSLFDRVFWYNQFNGNKSNFQDTINEWKKFDFYHDLEDYPHGRISHLPEPFNDPDLIVIEQCYPFAKSKIIFDLLVQKRPYIIVPRGEFTKAAQEKKAIKKRLANTVVFNRLVHRALSIQYLTEEEKETSDTSWFKNNPIIVPNGTAVPENQKSFINRSTIKCISIGRVAVFHKGIDLLIDACSEIKRELDDANVSVDIYGPDREHKIKELEECIASKELSGVIRFHDGIYGAEKERIIRESDVFIMTSRFEGHPTGLLEAIAYGMPCVVTTGSNMRKEIEAVDAGWTANNDAESIKEALLAMIADKNRFEEKGRNARNLAKEYDWNTIAERTHDVYKSLLKGKNQ